MPREASLTRAVDVHVDGLLVALGLQEQQLRNNQAGDAVVDLQVGMAGVSSDGGGEKADGVAGDESGNQDGGQSPSE